MCKSFRFKNINYNSNHSSDERLFELIETIKSIKKF